MPLPPSFPGDKKPPNRKPSKPIDYSKIMPEILPDPSGKIIGRDWLRIYKRPPLPKAASYDYAVYRLFVKASSEQPSPIFGFWPGLEKIAEPVPGTPPQPVGMAQPKKPQVPVPTPPAAKPPGQPPTPKPPTQAAPPKPATPPSQTPPPQQPPKPQAPPPQQQQPPKPQTPPPQQQPPKPQTPPPEQPKAQTPPKPQTPQTAPPQQTEQKAPTPQQSPASQAPPPQQPPTPQTQPPQQPSAPQPAATPQAPSPEQPQTPETPSSATTQVVEPIQRFDVSSIKNKDDYNRFLIGLRQSVELMPHFNKSRMGELRAYMDVLHEDPTKWQQIKPKILGMMNYEAVKQDTDRLNAMRARRGQIANLRQQWQDFGRLVNVENPYDAEQAMVSLLTTLRNGLEQIGADDAVREIDDLSRRLYHRSISAGEAYTEVGNLLNNLMVESAVEQVDPGLWRAQNIRDYVTLLDAGNWTDEQKQYLLGRFNQEKQALVGNIRSLLARKDDTRIWRTKDLNVDQYEAILQRIENARSMDDFRREMSVLRDYLNRDLQRGAFAYRANEVKQAAEGLQNLRTYRDQISTAINQLNRMNMIEAPPSPKQVEGVIQQLDGHYNATINHLRSIGEEDAARRLETTWNNVKAFYQNRLHPPPSHPGFGYTPTSARGNRPVQDREIQQQLRNLHDVTNQVFQEVENKQNDELQRLVAMQDFYNSVYSLHRLSRAVNIMGPSEGPAESEVPVGPALAETAQPPGAAEGAQAPQAQAPAAETAPEEPPLSPQEELRRMLSPDEGRDVPEIPYLDRIITDPRAAAEIESAFRWSVQTFGKPPLPMLRALQQIYNDYINMGEIQTEEQARAFNRRVWNQIAILKLQAASLNEARRLIEENFDVFAPIFQDVVPTEANIQRRRLEALGTALALVEYNRIYRLYAQNKALNRFNARAAYQRALQRALYDTLGIRDPEIARRIQANIARFSREKVQIRRPTF